MLLKQETVLCTLNRLFNQSAKIRKGTDAVYFCPICNHYKRKLEVNLNTGRYHCWVCDFSGLSLRSLFKKLKAPKDYYLILGEVDQMQSSERSFDNLFEIKNNNEKLNLLPEEFKPFSVPVKSYDFNRGLKYLLSRNITKYDILRYNIGYCDSGYYKNRIVIPSYDITGKLNFFSARDYTESDYIKYRLCDFSKNIIGNEFLIDFNQPITLVEGQFDAIAVRRNAIPLFGKTLSKKLKAKLLENDTPRVNVLLDNDARLDAFKICDFLIRNDIDTYLIELNDKDPSVLGFEKTWVAINAAKKMTFDTIIKEKLL